jgi:hypothetical protein
LDRRRTIVKLLLKEAQVVDCGTIEDEADAERWLQARSTRERVTFEPGAAREIIRRAGLDIVRLRAAFDRVVLYALGQSSITADDVRESVPAGPEAQEDFGIANAIRNNDVREALKQLTLALDAQLLDAVLGSVGHLGGVDLAIREVQADGRAVGDDAFALFVVHEAADLAQAPAQLAARIVRHVPQQLAERAAAERPRGEREVGEQGAHLARAREGRRAAAAQHAQRAQHPDRKACGPTGISTPAHTLSSTPAA